MPWWPVVAVSWLVEFGLLCDWDSMEGWCERWSQLFGWGGVSLPVFVMAAELLLIKFLAVTDTVFNLLILIDGVKQENHTFVEFSVSKTYLYDCTSREHSRGLWPGGCALGGAVHSGCWWSGHPLNSGRGVGTKTTVHIQLVVVKAF